jgi:hypothetical protein
MQEAWGVASTSGSYVGWVGFLKNEAPWWGAPASGPPSPPHTPPCTYVKHLISNNQGRVPLGEPQLERHGGGRGRVAGWGCQLPTANLGSGNAHASVPADNPAAPRVPHSIPG